MKPADTILEENAEKESEDSDDSNGVPKLGTHESDSNFLKIETNKLLEKDLKQET